jgi:hypothetical protein
MQCERDIKLFGQSDVCLTRLVWDKRTGKWVCPKSDQHL